MTDEALRERFERLVQEPPYERNVTREPETGGWPDQYRDYHVQLAWDLALALVREVEQAQGWQPIETAPKDRYIIISDAVCLPDVAIWCPLRPAYTDKFGTQWAERPEGWFNVSRSRIAPTMWMPLPDPPEVQP